MVICQEEQTRDYMISRAKSCLLSGDTSYAKCWIMTANALFPHNDLIKFEAYQMCKCESNVEEATKYFCEMFTTDYENDRKLLNEMRLIVISCRNEWQSCKQLSEQQLNELWNTDTTSNNSSNNSTKNWSKFYNQLFVSLSPQYQYQLVKTVANTTEDKLILIDLLLFTLKRFPKSVSENGIKLIEIMEDCEHNYSSNVGDNQNIVNYLRKKLVFDVLPIIFDANNAVILPQELMLKLMQKSLKYFVEQVISTETELIERNSSNSSKINLEICEIEAKIIEIFQLIGTKNDWQLFKSIDYSDDSLNKMETVYEKISKFIDAFRFSELSTDTDLPIDLSSASTAKINSGDEQTNQQILYSALLLFLLCLRQYFKLSADNVLIEQTSANFSDSNLKITINTSNKKRKLQCNEPELTTNSVELKQVFIVASKTLKLLKENLTINSEFSKLSEIIGLDGCRSFQSFLIDSYIYRAEYTKLVDILSRKTSQTKANSIQLISVSLMLRDYKAAYKYCLDCMESITMPPKDSLSKEKESQSSAKCASYDSNTAYSRHLIFLPLNLTNILRYVIEVIVLCLKDLVIMSLTQDDTGIGHLIVLSQYDWPNQVHLFFTCISTIRNPSKYHSLQSTQPKFTYHSFLNYVFIPDIIEEFMSLADTKDILFELKPSKAALGTPLKSSSKVITTRGVNKGVKEEIRSALMSQMKISKSQIPSELFIEFINKEIRSYLVFLNK